MDKHAVVVVRKMSHVVSVVHHWLNAVAAVNVPISTHVSTLSVLLARYSSVQLLAVQLLHV